MLWKKKLHFFCSSLPKIKKRYEELLEEFLEHKKLEKINKRIEEFEILERNDMKEEIELIKRIETKILGETEVLQETERKFRKVIKLKSL